MSSGTCSGHGGRVIPFGLTIKNVDLFKRNGCCNCNSGKLIFCPSISAPCSKHKMNLLQLGHRSITRFQYPSTSVPIPWDVGLSKKAVMQCGHFTNNTSTSVSYTHL